MKINLILQSISFYFGLLLPGSTQYMLLRSNQASLLIWSQLYRVCIVTLYGIKYIGSPGPFGGASNEPDCLLELPPKELR